MTGGQTERTKISNFYNNVCPYLHLSVNNTTTKREIGYNASISFIIGYTILFLLFLVSMDPPASCRPNCRKRTNCESTLK